MDTPNGESPPKRIYIYILDQFIGIITTLVCINSFFQGVRKTKNVETSAIKSFWGNISHLHFIVYKDKTKAALIEQEQVETVSKQTCDKQILETETQMEEETIKASSIKPKKRKRAQHP